MNGSDGRGIINESIREFTARFRDELANTELASSLRSGINQAILPSGGSRLITYFRVLALIVRENTERTYKNISRSFTYYVSAAFVTGFAFGVTLGVLVQRGLRDRNTNLEIEIRAIREELTRRNGSDFGPGQRPVKFGADLSENEDDSGADDFFDAMSVLGFDDIRGTSSSFPSASSSLSIFSSASLTSHGKPFVVEPPLSTEIASELDELADAALANPEEGLGWRAFARCLVYKKRLQRNPHFLWRFARAAYLVSVDLERGVFRDDGGGVEVLSPTLQTADQIIALGVSASKRAAQLADAGLSSGNDDFRPEDAALVYKWLAILVGVLANNSAISKKIQLGFDFKVYNLSWIERQFASRLFAAPPTSTAEEAMAAFLEVERLKPNHWAANQVCLAKCEYSRSQYAQAVRWIISAENLLNNESAIIGDSGDRDKLLLEIAVLRPQYEAYLS